jgi:G3E family GTPase
LKRPEVAADLPVVVIGGYLGAGKTTLVNHLLRHAGGRRLAVLVNDFGSINIDADLLADSAAGAQADVLSLAGGCLCCSFGNDLVGTLRAVQQRVPAVDAVLIELSGVALPAAVRRTLTLVPGVVCAGTLVLADAAQVQAQAADRYVGETVMQQLREADWVLLNKPDLADASTRAAAQAWAEKAAPAARVFSAASGDLPAELVLDWRAQTQAQPKALQIALPIAQPSHPWAPKAYDGHARGIFESQTRELPIGTDLQALGRELASAASGVLRAKGYAFDASGQCALLQVAGSRWAVTPFRARGPGQLVLIGLRGRINAGL